MDLKPRRLLLLGLASLVAMCAAGCSHSSSAEKRPTPAQIDGQEIYTQQCAPCHEATTDLHLLKTPPKLDGLFQKQKLPSGAPATDEEVRNTILHGLGIMPPFDKSVDPLELDDLIQYLHTR